MGRWRCAIPQWLRQERGVPSLVDRAAAVLGDALAGARSLTPFAELCGDVPESVRGSLGETWEARQAPGLGTLTVGHRVPADEIVAACAALEEAAQARTFLPERRSSKGRAASATLARAMTRWGPERARWPTP